MSKNLLSHVVGQIDAVRLQLEQSPTDHERELLESQAELLHAQVADLVPNPASRKATGTIGPQGQTRRKVRS